MEEAIKSMEDTDLWLLLMDISRIMSTSNRPNNETTYFWLNMGSIIKTELDNRLLKENG